MNLKAGRYELSPSMDTEKIVNVLKSGKTAVPERLVVPEGYSLDQIADRIVQYAPTLKKKDVLAKMDDHTFVEKMIESYPDTVTKDVLNQAIKHPLEGYLYPATYEFKEAEPKIDTILEEMVKATQLNLAPYREELKKTKEECP